MPLITLRDVSIGFRGPPLLDETSCLIEAGQRIGLLGRNGAGKTTLLRMLAGQVEPDHGEIVLAPATKVAWLPQDVPEDVTGPVARVVAAGLPEQIAAWEAEQQVAQILSRMELKADVRFETLSSGMKRRVLLAQALVVEPDVLLLDEPTNHLDLEAITWLEDFLSRHSATLIFVTHDRAFLRRMANRILEIDRGRLFDWSCDYSTFLKRKEAELAAEEKQNALFDRRLAEEEIWIRQGIKARRTRNEGRVRALEQMRKERSERREKQGSVRLEIQEAQRSGRLVAEAKEIVFGYDGQAIVERFSTTILRGDKIGVVGRNGAGKTTLLRLLLGQLEPQAGTVRTGTNLEIAYFDQLRQQLDGTQSVADNVADGRTSIQLGDRSRHIIGYLSDFLFTPEQARLPVRFLSGGERNRVLLARLFAKPANVLVLDEPTNDLDTETLELLEERLAQFAGTVLLVSHDREFLNNVVTSTIVFEPEGVKEYVGGYDDWRRQRAQQSSTTEPEKPAAKSTRNKPRQQSGPRRLSYKEQRELDALPATIETLEAQLATLHETMADAQFYQQASDRIAAEQARLKELEAELAEAYRRWEELEGISNF